MRNRVSITDKDEASVTYDLLLLAGLIRAFALCLNLYTHIKKSGKFIYGLIVRWEVKSEIWPSTLISAKLKPGLLSQGQTAMSQISYHLNLLNYYNESVVLV